MPTSKTPETSIVLTIITITKGYVAATKNLSEILTSPAQTLESVSFSSNISVNSGGYPAAAFSLWSFSTDSSGSITVSQIGETQSTTVLAVGKSITISVSGLNLTSNDSVFLLISSNNTSYGESLTPPTYTVPNFSLTGTVIPEPSAFGLLAGIGVLALAVSRRQRER